MGNRRALLESPRSSQNRDAPHGASLSLARVMHVHLRKDLSYCLAGGRIIFLDVRRDCYFRLSHELERKFLSCMKAGAASEADAAALVESNIVTGDPRFAGTTRQLPGSPSRSALEQPASTTTLTPGVMADVFCAVVMTRLQLRIRKLYDVLTELAAYRERRAPGAGGALSGTEMTRLLEEAALFRRARRYVPVEPRCLLDSLSLTRYLAGRGLHACTVFGVIGDPFAAHCWVQAEDLALNETVGDAESFAPILAI